MIVLLIYMIQAFIFILKMLFKIIIFTGFWITVIIVLAVDIGLPYIIPDIIPARVDLNYNIYEKTLTIVSLIPAICITCINTVRLFALKQQQN